MTTQQPRTRAVLNLLGIAFVLLFSGWWLVRPAYAATEYLVDCPANGNGSVDMLKAAIVQADKTPELDTIVINVTGAECVFTLVNKDPNTTSMGLPIIHYDLIIRAVGGRAVIERSPTAPAFSILRTVEDLTLENLTLRNGIALPSIPNGVAPGGAIDGRALTLTNVILTNNASLHGGAVHVYGPLVMNHVTASQNQTQGSGQGGGGAIVVFGPLTASHITVTHNAATYNGYGGGIYAYGDADITSALFAHNRADEHSGGGLYVQGNATLANIVFMSNTANLDGGGLFVLGNLSLSNSEIAGNVTKGNGGGLSVSGGLTLTSSLFFSNAAESNGGGAFVSGATVVTDTHFIRNRARLGGGGLAEGESEMLGAQPKTTRVEASTFISNEADYGGGAYILSGVVQKNLFEQNSGRGTSAYFGGGALMVASHGTVQNNRFIRNTAPLGGAFHLMFYPPSAISAGSQVVNNLWIDNEATAGVGGAIAVGVNVEPLLGGYVEIKHNTIANKKRSISSAIYVARSTADVTNNIISQNRSGVQAINSSMLVDANVFHNNAIDYVGTEGGPNDLVADPLFVDPANHDYHLQEDSPAQDSALDLGVAADFDGVSRPQGKGVDRGAFEILFINHAPLSQSDTYTTAVNTPLVIAAPGVLVNDSDPDADVLTATIVTVTSQGETTLQPDGTFIYTPTAGFTGTDTFTYQATDGVDLSAAVPVTIQVSGATDEPPTQPVAISGIQATYGGPAQMGNKVAFIATVESGSDVHFAWEFGDGATAVGATPSHIYAASGQYGVTVTASNSLGNEVTSFQVTVLPGAPTQRQLFTPFIAK